MSLFVKLNDERGEQLRAYAEAHGLGVTEAIATLLKGAGAAETVPGFKLAPLRFSPDGKLHGITLIFGDFSAVLTTEHVFKVADHLDHCASTSGTGGRDITLSIRGEDVALLTIARHRRHSVIIAGKRLPDGETISRVLTLDIAHDLAEQLRRFVA